MNDLGSKMWDGFWGTLVILCLVGGCVWGIKEAFTGVGYAIGMRIAWPFIGLACGLGIGILPGMIMVFPMMGD